MTQPMSNGGGWFAELRRRKVVRVAIVYLIASWLAIQVAAETFEPMDAGAGPDSELVGHHLGGGDLLERQDHARRVLAVEVLAERRELADVHQLGLRDERAAALDPFQPTFHDQFRQRLSHRRTRRLELLGQLPLGGQRRPHGCAVDELGDAQLLGVVLRHLHRCVPSG